MGKVKASALSLSALPVFRFLLALAQPSQRVTEQILTDPLGKRAREGYIFGGRRSSIGR